MATLLGDAEGPAHTDWSVKGREGLSKKYLYAAKWIDFVKNAPRRIIETARGADREGDRSIAAGWFPDVEAGNTSARRVAREIGSEDETPPPPPPPPPPSKPRVRMSEIDGGFSLTLTEHGHNLAAVRCICAYNIRKGDPFGKWMLDDFDIKKMSVEVMGGSVAAREDNFVEVNISDPTNFLLYVRGFDVNRDVATTIHFAENGEAAE